MTVREELASALAMAEAARERLEADLAKAAAALVNTVTDAARIDADRADASAKVEKARARCRQLRAALVKTDHPNPITRSRERFNISVEQSAMVSKPGATSIVPAIQSREQAIRGEDKRSQGEFRRRNLLGRFRKALATLPHLRETTALFALVLSYLQYYYIDVQVQILHLPMVVAFLAHQ